MKNKPYYPTVLCSVQKLGDDKQSLYLRVGQLKKEVQRLAAQYESGKAELNQNETHVQVSNRSAVSVKAFEILQF